MATWELPLSEIRSYLVFKEKRTLASADELRIQGDTSSSCVNDEGMP